METATGVLPGLARSCYGVLRWLALKFLREYAKRSPPPTKQLPYVTIGLFFRSPADCSCFGTANFFEIEMFQNNSKPPAGYRHLAPPRATPHHLASPRVTSRNRIIARVSLLSNNYSLNKTAPSVAYPKHIVSCW